MPNSFEIKHADEFETLEGSGGAKWTLARRGLDLTAFGMNLVEIPAGGSIVAHDETASGQVEVYAILEGDAVLEVNGADHAASAGTWARFDAEVERNIHNRSDAPLTALLIGCPTETGYEPMSWA
ncbi:MAG: cupin domain-containing protein [Solirubrobacterales bacterium]